MPTRLQIAKKDIIKVFESTTKRIWKYTEIAKILSDNKGHWRLAQKTTINEFVTYLMENAELSEVKLSFPSRKEKRFIWGNMTIYEILMGLNDKAYFSHYTAMLLNDLTNQIPKTIYLNIEQPERNVKNVEELEQANIHRAFSNKPRTSNNFTVYQTNRIYLLNGKQSGNLGVEQIQRPNESVLRVTNIERTLIDMVVRPVYSGGVYEILEAYKKAKDRVSVNKLMSYLFKLKHTYPYDQAIGFYLEKAGYRENQITLVEQPEMKNDFYLDYKIIEPSYSSRWRLFYPKGM